MLLDLRVSKTLVSSSLVGLGLHSSYPRIPVVWMGLPQPAQNMMILAVEEPFHWPLQAKLHPGASLHALTVGTQLLVTKAIHLLSCA